jgi:hypothetical protein
MQARSMLRTAGPTQAVEVQIRDSCSHAQRRIHGSTGAGQTPKNQLNPADRRVAESI